MIIMKCISCGDELEYAAAFLTAEDGHMWAVCRECLSLMTAKHIRECEYTQIPDEMEREYDPGLIEEGL